MRSSAADHDPRTRVTRQRIPWRRTLVLALVAAIALAGCGGPGTDALEDAVAATRAAGPLAVDIEGTVSPDGAAVLQAVDATGVVDLATGDRRMDVEVLPGSDAGYDVEVVVVDGVVHARGLPGLPEGSFVRVDGAPQAISADLGPFVDPEALLGLLTSLRGDVQDLGRETVGGVTTTRLRVVLPPDRMASRVRDVLDGLASSAPADLQADVLDVLDVLEDGGGVVASAAADVWIDADGVIRQMALDTESSVGGSRSLPGTGAIDNALLLRLDPDRDAPAPTVPEGVAGRTPFGALVLGGFGAPSEGG